jgi:hypothetical protein
MTDSHDLIELIWVKLDREPLTFVIQTPPELFGEQWCDIAQQVGTSPDKTAQLIQVLDHLERKDGRVSFERTLIPRDIYGSAHEPISTVKIRVVVSVR